jgi:hypothetical protein
MAESKGTSREWVEQEAGGGGMKCGLRGPIIPNVRDTRKEEREFPK